MDALKQKKAAKAFVEKWINYGAEQKHKVQFWTELLHDVYGLEDTGPEYVEVEKTPGLGSIDIYLHDTKVLIEQKGAKYGLDDKELRKQGKNERWVTPYEQALDYVKGLSSDDIPKYIITCNFKEFRIYDTRIQPKHKYLPDGSDLWYSKYETVFLEDLEKDVFRMNFLVKAEDVNIKKEKELSEEAGRIVAKIYDELLKQYVGSNNSENLRSLNKLCVRLVFCLYAEDSGVFPEHLMFHNYLQARRTDARDALIKLFQYLNTDEEIRKNDTRWIYEKEDLKAFPYVNGGMFEDENIIIPQIPPETVDIILKSASEEFDWSEISCTIFGSIFEDTLNPETRRSSGMHYTSVENIHKVIDPLFMNELYTEYNDALSKPSTGGARTKALQKLHDKLGRLIFFDPACGSGNFLTESYLSLRQLENKILDNLKNDYNSNQATLKGISAQDLGLDIKVSIQQFYGIEINDFAVAVAKTALWISEAQMLSKTLSIGELSENFLPLEKYENIHHENALRTDWNDIVSANRVNFCFGNPPFRGKKYQSPAQKEDMKLVFGSKTKGIGNLDYVTAWYKKAADYMSNGKNIKAAFVSTNSVTQGEHIPLFWKPLYEQYDIDIDFGYQSFKWDSTSQDSASVECVVIGFSTTHSDKKKCLYFNDGFTKMVDVIHPYLYELPLIFIENRSTPLSPVPALVYGSFALDDGNYTIDESTYNELISTTPEIKKFLKPFIGSEEFINGKKRYCIWLKDADIREVRKIRPLLDRIQKVQEWRSSRKRKETVVAARTPMLFAEIRQPDSDYLAIPITSSENRDYIPMGYMSNDIIASNHLLVLPNATLYEFGILTSSVHMAWMKVVAGRLESRYNYSARVVYNNFPWCTPTDAQRKKIENTAQDILNARSLYPQYNLAELYDKRLMPEELSKAHLRNNIAVLEAYGFTKDTAAYSDGLACAKELLLLYKKYADLNNSNSNKCK